MQHFSGVKALTFDLFGTVLDLGGSLTPYIAEFLKAKGSDMEARDFWEQWRARQRVEQYQDNILMLGHSGYLETAHRGFVFTLRRCGIDATQEETREFMRAWQELSPFPDVVPALERLKNHFRLVALSNGEAHYLKHLAENRIRWSFDDIISVEVAGAFKPHPGVYRKAATLLGLEVGECLMVSAHTFDVVGARACGFRAILIDRYKLPLEEVPYRPDRIVKDFNELADLLG